MKTPIKLLVKAFCFSLAMLTTQLYAVEMLEDGNHLTKWMCGIEASAASLELSARTRGQSEADEQLYRSLQPASIERVRSLLGPLEEADRSALVRQVGMVTTPFMTDEEKVDVVGRILGLNTDPEQRGRVIYGALEYLESLQTWDKRVQILRYCNVYESARSQSATVKRFLSQVFSDLGGNISYSELSDVAQKAGKNGYFAEYMRFIGINKVNNSSILWNLLECHDASEFPAKFETLTGSRPILELSAPHGAAGAAADGDLIVDFARRAAAVERSRIAIDEAIAPIITGMDEGQIAQVKRMMSKFNSRGVEAMVSTIVEIFSTAGDITPEARLGLIRTVTSSEG